MKTRLFVLSIALLIGASPAQAARLAPQVGPTSTPVQPIPEGTAPNYKGNINYSAPEIAPPQDSAAGFEGTFSEPTDKQQTNAAAGQSAQAGKAKTGNAGLLAALILIAAGLTGYVYFRNKKA